MDAKQRNLKDIFDTQCRYLVPLYQRPYVWRRKAQWLPLWDDVQALAERYMRKDTRPHFMGAVVLDQLNSGTGTIDLRQVIDGQQRLTTLQILIEAAGDVCDGIGDEASHHKSAFRQLTRNIRREHDDEVFKVWPTNSDRDTYRKVMLAESPADVREKYGLEPDEDSDFGIANAYFCFCERIEAWLNAPDGPGTLADRLTGLQSALYKGLSVVVIDLNEKDDAQVIFETLNARGTPLLASDLVKNFLLHKADPDEGSTVDLLYESYWKPFDSDGFWRKRIRQGRLIRPRIELFIQHYLTLKTHREVITTRLFDEFREHVQAVKGETVASHLASLHHYGRIFYDFEHYPSDSREGVFFKRIEALDTSTVFPLLLQVFDRLAKPSHQDQRRGVLVDLESFLIRRMFCELTTKNYNNLFLEVGRKVAEADAAKIRQVIRDHLTAQTSDIGRWPDDEEFVKGWSSLRAYKRLKPQIRLRMVLEALELRLRESGMSEEQELPKARLSVEHILPRGWTSHWPLASDDDVAREAREALLHTMGNLTLVTKKLNSSLSNDPWSKKRKTLHKHTTLKINVLVTESDEWDEAEIKRRSKTLFKMATAVWPFPQ